MLALLSRLCMRGCDGLCVVPIVCALSRLCLRGVCVRACARACVYKNASPRNTVPALNTVAPSPTVHGVFFQLVEPELCAQIQSKFQIDVAK